MGRVLVALDSSGGPLDAPTATAALAHEEAVGLSGSAARPRSPPQPG